ncbi:MAG: 23S rRNA (adenine(2503)-C(2))-methyltransferase RlmN [Spirochaetia bacterium]|jgi:23S rRNA (adenine2503-C2)-methyltransferase|nr:23S rRNA (adenine(2503)-C(2))-methyltransferase RlmN [Spirochaetia bacterium]
MKIPLSGMLPDEICTTLSLVKTYRGRQIFKAIYSGAKDIKSVTTLPSDMRLNFEEKYTLLGSFPEKVLKDDEGTGKMIIILSDKVKIECVLLTDGKGRKTACISTQAGCAMGCLFCKTGESGFFRNLSSSEITEQFIHLTAQFGHISNIVFMGMGEPLDNIENLFKAAEVLSHQDGAGMSPKKMTVSTCGIADKIKFMADNGPPLRLALSLNASVQAKREKIMPIAKKYPLSELKKALIHYQEKRGKRITLEYVLIKGFNTGRDDAEAVESFVKGLSAIVNLIPWNPAPRLDFETPSDSETARFCRYLDALNINYALRREKGRTIKGACGQLASQQ